MPVARRDSIALVPLLHAPPCDLCGEGMRYGAAIVGDPACDEPKLAGVAAHVSCWSYASRGLRAARGVGAFLAACGRGASQGGA